MPKKTGIILLVVLIGAWAILAWVFSRTPQAGIPVVEKNSSGTVTVQTIGGGSAAPGALPVSAGQAVSAPALRSGGTAANMVIAPTAGAQWIVGDMNVVRWTKASGFTGYVYLVRASDGGIAGWLSGQTQPNDTSFSWNTRDLYLTRTSAVKKEVQPGRYLIKVGFDSPQWPPVMSVPFSIVLPGQAQVPVNTLTIQNGNFSAAAASVSQGSQLVFVNKDQVPYSIIISSFNAPFILEPGGSYSFDTSPLAPGGTYIFYATSSPALRINVTITAGR